jgi:PAS domain S-box-containing protein
MKVFPVSITDDNFFNFSVDLLCVIDFDGYFIRANSAFLSQLGYLDSELVLKSIMEFIQLEDHFKISEQFHSISQGHPALEFECHFCCRDGSYKHLQWKGGTDPDQRLIYAIAREVFELDVRVQQRTEELLKAQQILQDSEERFRQFAENLKQVFWMTEISNQAILYVSPAYEKVWGRSCESLYQDPLAWLTAIHPKDRERVRSLLPAQLRSEYNVEYRILRPDGEIRWIHDRSFPIRNEAGETYRVAGIAEDISDRKTAELSLFKMNEELERRVEQRTLDLKIAKETAEEASKAKSIFLVNMSHELCTPLNAILGFSQLLSEDTTLNSDQQENLRIINRSGAHLRTLINDVLDMSKIEVGRTTLIAKDCHLAQMLTDLKEIFSLKAEEKCLSLKVEQDLTVPRYIHADETKLRQVLFNLLGNALKFTQKGHVGLSVRIESDPLEPKSSLPQAKLIFAIEDTGIGIAPEEIDTIFQPFVQTRAGRNFQGGTGLGLPISQAFVQLMGGSISVTSEPGQGSCFQFVIPVTVIPTGAEIEPLSPHSILALQPNQDPLRLLVVDDQDPDALFTQCIQGLSQPLLKDLYQATLECDEEEVTLLIHAIQASSPQLFNHLTDLINRFRFEDIVALIKPWIEAS